MNREGLDTRAIVQVGFVVRDIERSIAALSRLLNTPEPEVIVTDPYESARTRYRGEPTEARAKLAFFPMGPVALELIEPIGGPSTWQEFLDEKGPGIHHIALKAEGTDRVVASLCEKGASLAQAGYYTGGRYTYLDTGPELGFVLELLEDLDESDPD